MHDLADNDLYRRGMATMLASWAAYAAGASSAGLERLPGVTAAVFPCEPERGVYNNAVLAPAPDAAPRTEAVEAMERTYEDAGVARFAAWVEEGDVELRRELERRGYVVDTSTLAMGMSLLDVPRTSVPAGVALSPARWDEYLESEDLPPDFLKAADHDAFNVLVARRDGEILGAALAYDLDGDCGIYNVSTREAARRRGLGSALTAAQLAAARARACRTASLQSTPMGEGVYRRLGFRALRRIVEYTPAQAG